MTYSDQFPDFPAADLPPIPEGFTDDSWHNDTCPSFYNAEQRLKVWIDYVDVNKREFPENEGRFQLMHTDEAGASLEPLGDATDDWQAMALLIAMMRK